MSTITSAIGNLFKTPKMPSTSVKMPDPGSFQTKLAAERKLEDDRRKGKAGSKQENIKTSTNYSGSNLGGTSG